MAGSAKVTSTGTSSAVTGTMPVCALIALNETRCHGRRVGPQGDVVDVVRYELVLVDMGQQRDEVPAPPEIDENRVADMRVWPRRA